MKNLLIISAVLLVLLSSCTKRSYVEILPRREVPCKNEIVCLDVMCRVKELHRSFVDTYYYKDLEIAVIAALSGQSYDSILGDLPAAAKKIENYYNRSNEETQISNLVISKIWRKEFPHQNQEREKPDFRKYNLCTETGYNYSIPTKDGSIMLEGVYEMSGTKKVRKGWFCNDHFTRSLENNKLLAAVFDVFSSCTTMEICSDIKGYTAKIQQNFNSMYKPEFEVKNLAFTTFEVSREFQDLRTKLEKSPREAELERELLILRLQNDSLITSAAKRDALQSNSQSRKLEVIRDHRQLERQKLENTRAIEFRKAEARENAAKNVGILRSFEYSE